MFYKKNSALIAGTLALCLSASLPPPMPPQ